jgi:hypothetical protein
VLGCLPDGVAHGELDAVYPGYGHKAAAVLRQVGLAFDEAGPAPCAAYPCANTMWRKLRRSEPTIFIVQLLIF